jgi:phospholipid/cholesterol/gamma-HCH transport system ATP-binding protein
VLVFRNVSIAFDGPPVLDDISFSVGPHETRILLGPAGVGKSVLLKLSNGLGLPRQESIELFGKASPTCRNRNVSAARTEWSSGGGCVRLSFGRDNVPTS